MKKLLGILIILGSLIVAVPTLAQTTNPFNFINLQIAQTLQLLTQQIETLQVQVRSLEAQKEDEGVEIQVDEATQKNNQVQIESVEVFPAPTQTERSRMEPGFDSGIFSQTESVSQPVSPTFTKYLYPGVQDVSQEDRQQVVELQNILVSQGLLTISDPTHFGIYGPATTRAVTDFQRINGLSTVGVVGPDTRQALNGVSGEGDIGKISKNPGISDSSSKSQCIIVDVCPASNFVERCYSGHRVIRAKAEVSKYRFVETGAYGKTYKDVSEDDPGPAAREAVNLCMIKLNAKEKSCDEVITEERKKCDSNKLRHLMNKPTRPEKACHYNSTLTEERENCEVLETDICEFYDMKKIRTYSIKKGGNDYFKDKLLGERDNNTSKNRIWVCWASGKHERYKDSCNPPSVGLP